MHIPAKLYRKILRMMPIPCVDLLVTDRQGRVLLVKRANEPARGQWWFPGGRVHYLETRAEAAARKLVEECGLRAVRMKEIGTFDVMLRSKKNRLVSHGVTTLFHVRVVHHPKVRLDGQSDKAEWRKPADWATEKLHLFVSENLKAFLS